MKLINRLKKLWALSKKDTKVIDKLFDNEIELIPDEDEQASFISEGTQEEYKEYLKQQSGVRKMLDRLL